MEKRFLFFIFFYVIHIFSPPFNFMMELVCGGTGDIQLNPSLFKKKKKRMLADASLLFRRRTQPTTPQQGVAKLALCLQPAEKTVASLDLIGSNMRRASALCDTHDLSWELCNFVDRSKQDSCHAVEVFSNCLCF